MRPGFLFAHCTVKYLGHASTKWILNGVALKVADIEMTKRDTN